MTLPVEFDYRGHEVVIATVFAGGRWRWSYEIDTGLPTTTMAADFADEAAAIAAATHDAQSRIDAMLK